MSCIFCKIIQGEVPSSTVYENDDVLAFKDISPDAPVHVLVIPKQHIGSILEVDTESGMMNKLIAACQHIAKELNIAETGFRIITNTGVEGGQSVDHLHLHLLGGRTLDWMPG